MQQKNYPILFTISTFTLLIASFILALDKGIWVLEVSPILIGFPILFFTYKHFQFTKLAYVLLIIHFLILCIGAIYTYAEVPLGYNMQEWFGFKRNNYDKIGHFAQGFIPTILIREVLLTKSPLQKGKLLNFIILSITLAISAAYELVEWAVALINGASAEAFLGTQGYEWDAQSDMWFALIGATCSLLLLSKLDDKFLAGKTTKASE